MDFFGIILGVIILIAMLFFAVLLFLWGVNINLDEPIIKTEITFGSKDDEDDKKD